MAADRKIAGVRRDVTQRPMTRRRLPIGIQTFRTLRARNDASRFHSGACMRLRGVDVETRMSPLALTRLRAAGSPGCDCAVYHVA